MWCGTCDGSGELRCFDEDTKTASYIECPDCEGSGTLCDECGDPAVAGSDLCEACQHDTP